MTGSNNAEDRFADALVDFLAHVPLLRSVDPSSPAEGQLWRACELCIYLGYRHEACPDPRSLSGDAIADWRRRGLVPGEGLSDPADMAPDRPFWLMLGGQRAGTVALRVQDPGWGHPRLWVSSLYVFPELRRSGLGTLVMSTLEGAARLLGFAGIRLETDWLWQGAVRFYLRQGYWVANWKRGLSLVRYLEDPGYRVRADQGQMTFSLCVSGDGGGGPAQGSARDTPTALICARRRGDTLIWEAHPSASAAEASAEGPRASPASTFALWLAVSGWPLVRGPSEWEQRHRWGDVGLPEGLAYKIGIFEAYARHLGLRVDTPRIPGLVYPGWQDLQ